MKKQLNSIGSRYQTPNRKSLTAHVRDVLKESFDEELNPEIWSAIDQASEFTNTFKHATEEKYRELFEKYPQFFSGANSTASDEDLSNFFGVTEDQFGTLSNYIERFWDELPHEVDYS